MCGQQVDEVQVNYVTKVSSVHTYVRMSCQYSEKGSVDLKISFSHQNSWQLNSIFFFLARPY